MIFINYKFTILVLMIKIISCVEYDCPNFYASSDGILHARIEVPTPNNHNNVIKFHVELSIGGSVSSKELENKLSFLGSPDDVINKRQLVFTLELPSHWGLFSSKITRISINDENFCSSDQIDIKNVGFVTNINLSNTLTISTFSSGGFSNRNPSTTFPPVPNTPRYVDITQIPTITYDFITPTTKPVNQNFQISNCAMSSQTISLIFGGDRAEKRAFPWVGALMKRIRNSPNFKCGATLITEKLAITAAHCIDPFSRSDLSLIFGRLHINDWLNDESQAVGVINTSVHPDYREYVADADIAILTLAKSLYFTDTVRPICLCKFDECFEKSDIKKGVVAGWGQTEDEDMSNTLKKIDVGIVTQENCLWSSSDFNSITSNRTFCAGDKNGEGPCRGDSGSGFYMLIRGQWTLRGIVSQSLAATDGSCDLSQYIIYVDVAKHFDWIYSFL